MIVRQALDPLFESLPIFLIGAGGIVRDAHLPAYRKAGYRVAGICDLDRGKADRIKENFPEVETVYDSLDEFLADWGGGPIVFDVAIPADGTLAVLEKLPYGAIVLMQKPMGETLSEAQTIMRLCEGKSLTAAVNFQLRYAPLALAARSIIGQGVIGDVFDMEIVVCVHTPWELWGFLANKPRVEILYHSIHYLDLVRSVLGEPAEVYASTLKHPLTPHLASTRSTIILDYDEFTQARIVSNHGHRYGLQEQQSYMKIEGTKGAIKAQIGVSLNYPAGMPDTFSFVSDRTGGRWTELKLSGNWFPDAFIGPMTELQRLAGGADSDKLQILRDNYETMRLVEIAYETSGSRRL